ncbi:DNA ligase [Sulfuriroseicoccus oceanibius]|uniref:DNA ligase n=1 Tax=Sulfuriroseicoccus oceanibius TaxID=2707525 RepID=A0A7T7JBC4_9BACT|nr:DNA ligase [Sulfuriroseicoccus oceanibius]
MSVLAVMVGAAGEAPALQHAKTYAEVVKGGRLELAEYWVSEKLDGVRAFWDGTKLRSRQGNVIHAPQWFIEGLPENVVMDGELWAGRGKFELVSGTVRREVPEDEAWRAVRYCIFDLPEHGGIFDERVVAMRRLVENEGTPWLVAVEQFRVQSVDMLHAKMDAVVQAGGEGLMLHRGGARYQHKRTDDLIKLKPLEDAEAVVVGYVPGKGKFEGMLGALEVQLPNGERFKIGTGFSDDERRNPPAIGEIVTFQYSGRTANGIPRFARFLRVRVAH